ncbi:MAG: hypothetical protein Q7R90_02960 [bacterium]|nr:hypothetical protein [bacterium]
MRYDQQNRPKIDLEEECSLKFTTAILLTMIAICSMPFMAHLADWLQPVQFAANGVARIVQMISN